MVAAKTRKDAHIMARCTQEKLERVKEFAAARDLTVADFINDLIDNAIDGKPIYQDFDNLVKRVEMLENRFEAKNELTA